MCCSRKVGVWVGEHLEIAECWLEVGHRWECHDLRLGLRWQPGEGTDTTGRQFLIALQDVPMHDQLEAAEGSGRR